MKTFILSAFFLIMMAGNAMGQLDSTLRWIFQNDTCHYQTKNKKFKLKFGGRIFADAAYYIEDKTELESGGEIRDLRLRLDLSYAKKWSASINVDFSEMESEMKDTYIRYDINSKSFLRGGYFYEPFGIEQTESTNSTRFMHVASTVEALRPGRNIGVEYKRWDDFYYVGAGVFGDLEFNEEEYSPYYYYWGFSNRDDDDNEISVSRYGISARAVVLPVLSSWSILHIGASGNYWVEDKEDRTLRFQSRAATHIENDRLIGLEVEHIKSQMMYGLELICTSGDLLVQTELIKKKVYRESNYDDYTAEGWYVQFGYILKGNSYKYNRQSARIFQPGKGTIELVARYNETDLNDSGVYNFKGMGGRQRDYSLGANWYISRNVLMRLNYTKVDLDRYAMNGEESIHMIQSRLQYSF
ncbi:OprO/OprP family phosphate-selective porin [Marinifilum caeruleilacunae]|uniref:Porin n=1 Tax=Marinifilum caeruleilacunae TaxID=2499076 RepID=A0ABX1WU05_9BACT|nr:porin [Marinifilum caeruleilacunae]NOU59590.1 hypothetical protein [Marinifilum caeruleilacunae]